MPSGKPNIAQTLGRHQCKFLDFDYCAAVMRERPLIKQQLEYLRGKGASCLYLSNGSEKTMGMCVKRK